MGEYIRSTRACSFEQLRPELVSAIREYVADRKLGDIEPDILMCCETTSEKLKKGFFRSLMGGDPDPIHYIGALVTPIWLIWARSGPKSGTVVLSARLKDVQVKDFESDLIQDTGLEVFGFVGNSTERMHVFIGLGQEPPAQKFAETVMVLAAQDG